MKSLAIGVVTALLISTSATTLADSRSGKPVGMQYADERSHGLLHVGDRSYIGSKHRGQGYGKGHGYKRDFKKDHRYKSGHRYKNHKRGKSYHERKYRGHESYRNSYRNSYRGGHDRRYYHRDRRHSGRHYHRRGSEIFIGIIGGSAGSGGLFQYRESR